MHKSLASLVSGHAQHGLHGSFTVSADGGEWELVLVEGMTWLSDDWVMEVGDAPRTEVMQDAGWVQGWLCYLMFRGCTKILVVD